MKRTIPIVLLLLMVSTIVQAQCNSRLVDIAASQSGKDAVYVREFKIRLKAGDAKVPAPVGHFNALLKQGVTYRFNIANARELDGKGVLQLFDKSTMLASTYDFQNKTDLGSFDFVCPKTTTYQVLISFLEAKEGCAVGILSMVVDTSAIEKQEKDTTLEVLYRDIPNPLTIDAPLKKGEHIDLKIDKGSIIKSENIIQALVGEQEQATITISIMDSTNKIVEETSKIFNVSDLPLPYVIIGNSEGDVINKHSLMNNPKLSLKVFDNLDIQPYKLIDYVMFERPGFTEQFSAIQLKQIENMNSGEKLYIKDIRVQHPNGKIIKLPTAVFTIE